MIYYRDFLQSLVVGFLVIINTRYVISLQFSDWKTAGCPVPGPIQNGNSWTDYFGYIAHFQCNEGYKMIGVPKAFCASASWNNPAPTCEQISENDLSVQDSNQRKTPIFGYKAGESNSILTNNIDQDEDIQFDVLDYSCVYLAVTPIRIKPKAPAIENGYIFSYLYRRNNFFPHNRYIMANYTCHDGFQFVDGKQIIYCQEESWIGTLPRCVPISDLPKTLINDPCMYKKGECEHKCIVVGSEANCACFKGYLLAEDGKSCQDINECLHDLGGCQFWCYNRPGTFYCYCPKGYKVALDYKTCLDQDECQLNNGHGPCQDKCFNSRGDYSCECHLPGTFLAKDNTTCTDIDECAINNHNCSHICTNTYGSAFCFCPIGLTLADDMKTCEDIDECELGLAKNCTGCTNTFGSYTCACSEGYQKGEDEHCQDADECLVDNFGCSHECINTPGSAYCGCPAGYASVGKTCMDIDECSYNYCPDTCINTPGSYSCGCQGGYTLGANNHCEDINECALNNFECSHECINTPGSAYCSCATGFELTEDKKTCKDIDECSSALTNNCNQAHHVCINTPGSFKCACDFGYLLLSTNRCEGCQINSYMSPVDNFCHDCPTNSHTNGTGKTSVGDCICDEGYSGDLSKDSPCKDIDECQISNGGCQHICVNNPKEYQCACYPGYQTDPKDNKKCIDTNECLINKGGCSQICNNYDGGFFCSCRESFVLSEDGISCIGQSCLQLLHPENGTVLPASCATGKVSVGEKCYYMCNQGFHMIGEPIRRCTKSAGWRPNDIPVVCEKVSPNMYINCPSDITVDLKPGQNKIDEITLPRPDTNVDWIDVQPQWALNGIFPAGTNEISFTAVSKEGQTKTCTMKINVLDKEPPQIQKCPRNIDGVLSPTGEVRWEELSFADNVALDKVRKSHDPGQRLKFGSHVVKYTASDTSGNIAECIFTLVVKRRDKQCSELIGPHNGDKKCKKWSQGDFCEPSCPRGFMFYTPINYIFTCQADGIWTPSNQVPDCTSFIPAPKDGCLPGQERRKTSSEDICVDCPRGMYLSYLTSLCQLCNTGFYQDRFAQTSCRRCPPRKTTRSKGATGLNFCVDIIRSK